jgi:hypothetical protein
VAFASALVEGSPRCPRMPPHWRTLTTSARVTTDEVGRSWMETGEEGGGC